ncbi:hypothetical protein Zm00014a_007488 [Zea mays]|uniref:Uncharacterized protein n=1 Tax=Zea mays TaxID=4577 RepID=A0A3L6EID3_MAIZE|nr:hypothetical protein Zm00014a_007488 [Zea mays]
MRLTLSYKKRKKWPFMRPGRKQNKKEERGRSWIECSKRTGVKWRKHKERKLLSSSRKSWNDIWSWKGYKGKERKRCAERKWRRKKREPTS